jgi:hypothetical protein
MAPLGSRTAVVQATLEHSIVRYYRAWLAARQDRGLKASSTGRALSESRATRALVKPLISVG